MTLADWLVAAVTAAAAALLINAGATKVAGPDPLRLAVAELFPARGQQVTVTLVRAFGVVETLVAVGLLITPTRLASAVAGAALGGCFLAFGALGLARRSTLPCGCFGAASRRPPGWINIALGAAMLIPWTAVAVAGPVPAADHTAYSAAAPLLASISAVLLCLAQNRRLIKLLRRGVGPALSEVG